MIMTRLMTYAEATSIPPSFIPSSFQFSNYLEVFSRAPFLMLLWKHIIRVSIYNSSYGHYFVTSSLCCKQADSSKEKYCNDDFSFIINGFPYESIIFTNYQTIAQLGC